MLWPVSSLWSDPRVRRCVCGAYEPTEDVRCGYLEACAWAAVGGPKSGAVGEHQHENGALYVQRFGLLHCSGYCFAVQLYIGRGNKRIFKRISPCVR